MGDHLLYNVPGYSEMVGGKQHVSKCYRWPCLAYVSIIIYGHAESWRLGSRIALPFGQVADLCWPSEVEQELQAFGSKAPAKRRNSW